MSESKNSIHNVSRLLQLIVFSIVLLYLGRVLFIPLSFGLLVAIVAYPICRFLENKGWPKGIAVFALITVTVLMFVALLWLLVYEANLIIEDFPLVQERIQSYYTDLRVWLNESFGFRQEMQESVVKRFSGSLENNLGVILTGTISATSSTLVSLLLIPIFAALFLFHRATFVKFVELLAGKEYRKKVHVILQGSIVSYYRFVRGTFFVYCIVGVLNSIGLFFLGIEHAVLFGMGNCFYDHYTLRGDYY